MASFPALFVCKAFLTSQISCVACAQQLVDFELIKIFYNAGTVLANSRTVV